MKGMFKKALAGVAAAALAVTGLAVGASSASAAETTVNTDVTITLTGSETQLVDTTLSVYRIGDFVNYGTETNPVYGVVTNTANASEVESALMSVSSYETGDGDALAWALSQGLLGVDNDTWGYTGGTASSTVRKFANALAGKTKEMTPTEVSTNYTSNGVDSTLSFTVQTGIYLIVSTSTDGSVTAVPMIVSTGTVSNNAIANPAVNQTIEVKSNVATDKTKEVDKSSASIGDTLTFTLTGAITSPAPDSFEFTDKPGEGLTVDFVSIKVQACDADENGGLTDCSTLVEDTDYTVENNLTGDKGDGGSTFTVVITTPSKYAGKTIKVTYKATVNDAAGSSVVNELQDYDGKYTINTKTSLYGFEIDKVNADGQALANVTFNIKDGETALYFVKQDDGSYKKAESSDTTGATTDLVTDNTGKIVVSGLGAGDYTVVETQNGNNGYLDVMASFTVTINNGGTAVTITTSDDHGLATANGTAVTVLNVRSITELPKTGAAGIALFVVLGLLIAGAGAAVWMKSRSMRNAING